MAMRGMYQEALAGDEPALRKILQEYNKVLDENPMNVPIHKRRIALIRTMGRPQDAIISLVDLLDSFPSDVEGWCELGELYQTQGMGSQAIYCLEEALLAVPNAWNVHARIGELEYLNASTLSDGSEAAVRAVISAVQRFSRSIELCDDYLRGYYGLKLAVNKLLKAGSQSKSSPGLNTGTEAAEAGPTSNFQAQVNHTDTELSSDKGHKPSRNHCGSRIVGSTRNLKAQMEVIRELRYWPSVVS